MEASALFATIRLVDLSFPLVFTNANTEAYLTATLPHPKNRTISGQFRKHEIISDAPPHLGRAKNSFDQQSMNQTNDQQSR